MRSIKKKISLTDWWSALVGHARRRAWYAKRQSPHREWCTEHVKQIKWTIKTAVKWDVFLFAFIGPLLAIIGHYWPLLSNYYRIVYAQIFCRTHNSVNSQIRCRTVLTLVSLSLIRCNSLSVVASSWLSCRRFKTMSLVWIYPWQGLYS